MSVVVNILNEHVIPGKRLGRHVEHDPRSLAHPFGAVVSANALHSVTHRRYGPPFDQGALGSCTGNAAAGALNTVPLHKAARQLTELDAVDLYKLATTLDDVPGAFPPEDTGSSGLAVAKALQQRGLITAYKHAFSVDEALTALMLGPVITGVNWYESFDSPGLGGLVQIGGQVRGGHEFEVLGYHKDPDPEHSLVVCENSWGPSWGHSGRFSFTVKTWRQLLAEQGDATILVK